MNGFEAGLFGKLRKVHHGQSSGSDHRGSLLK